MNTPYAQPVSPGRSHLDAAPVSEGPFVINLCSSTTPVALSQRPQDPELKRFSFFVSRRLEDGRERFRLHMGYFETLREAEELLTAVREAYPGAWAGETPGRRLRAKAPPPRVEPRPQVDPPTVFPAYAGPVKPAPANAGAAKVGAPNAMTVKSAAPARPSKVAQLPLSNVREVLASLDHAGSTQQMPAAESRNVDRPHAGLSETSFAVQLQWSVQPLEIARVPPLAIFSAYTLYTVEGSREGRRWYGLRLGFFSDANSAKQVAQYVRSEFASVAVVPIGARERTRASKLTDDAEASSPVATRAPAKGNAPAKAGAATVHRAGKATGARLRAREKRSPQTLEETLDILGADQLEIADTGGGTSNDSGVRRLKVELRKQSPFTKLLGRFRQS